jgi:hypothetical protein
MTNGTKNQQRRQRQRDHSLRAFIMESTLEVARRAVDADSRRDWATAYALYTQAAAELDSFATSASGTRSPEELQGACVRACVDCVDAAVRLLQSAGRRCSMLARHLRKRARKRARGHTHSSPNGARRTWRVCV